MNTMQVGGKGVSATLVLQDASGNQGAPAAPPVWTSSDPAIATVMAAADGLSAQVLPAGATGVVTISAVVDANVHITGQITVTPGMITQGSMIFAPN